MWRREAYWTLDQHEILRYSHTFFNNLIFSAPKEKKKQQRNSDFGKCCCVALFPSSFSRFFRFLLRWAEKNVWKIILTKYWIDLQSLNSIWVRMQRPMTPMVTIINTWIMCSKTQDTWRIYEKAKRKKK